MDNLRFVLESPHLAQTQKKRPRLVTSCDNCRLKKIKCVQLKLPDGKCEACETASVDCQFRDRERYFAERSRIVTGSTGGSSSSHARRSSTPSVGSGEESVVSSSHRAYESSPTDGHSWYPGSAHSARLDSVHQLRYPSPTPAHRSASAQSTSSLWLSPEPPEVSKSVYDRPHYASSPLSHSGSNPSDYASYASSTGLPQDLSTTYSGRSSTSSAGLFDPRQPNLPNPNLMAHLLGVFCNNFERNFPFLQYEDLSRRLYNNSLSPILANSIAAISSRHSTNPEILTRGVSQVSDAYCNVAKRLLAATSATPYIEVLHAVVILFWTEYKAGRTSSCVEYSQMATKMAFNLGLGSESTMSASSEHERSMLRATWTSVAQMQQMTTTFHANSSSTSYGHGR